jgi:hypothetical protein
MKAMQNGSGLKVTLKVMKQTRLIDWALKHLGLTA